MDTPDFKSPWTYNLKESDPRLDPAGRTYQVVRRDDYRLMTQELVDRISGQVDYLLVPSKGIGMLWDFVREYHTRRFLNLFILNTNLVGEEDTRNFNNHNIATVGLNINLNNARLGILDNYNMLGIRQKHFKDYLLENHSPRSISYNVLNESLNIQNKADLALNRTNSTIIYPWYLATCIERVDWQFWVDLFANWLLFHYENVQECMKTARYLGLSQSELPRLDDISFSIPLILEMKKRLYGLFGLRNAKEIDNIVYSKFPKEYLPIIN